MSESVQFQTDDIVFHESKQNATLAEIADGCAEAWIGRDVDAGRVVDAARTVVRIEDKLTDTGVRDGLHEAWVELRNALGEPLYRS